MKANGSISFLHDADARHDPKIIKMWMKFGWNGYGIYWCLVEIMRTSSDFKIRFSDLEAIAIQIRVDKDLITSFIDVCCSEEILLFSRDDSSFWSNTFLRRMENFKRSREMMSLGGKEGMKNRYNKAKSKVVITTLKAPYKVKEKKRIEKNSFSSASEEEELKNKAVLILNHLNHKAGRKFSDSKQIIKMLKSGKPVDQFLQIIDTKLFDPFFIDNPNHFNPTTLFRESHWDTYINQKREDFKHKEQKYDYRTVGTADEFAADKADIERRRARAMEEKAKREKDG